MKLCFQMIKNRQWFWFLSLQGAHTVVVHHNINQLPRMWKWCTFSAAFSPDACSKMMKRESRDLVQSLKKVEKSVFSKTEQSVTCMAIMKARRGRGVSGCPGMLKEDKVAAWQRSPSPHPEAGFISWAQQERRLGFVPQKHVQLCVKVFSLTLCLSVSTQFLSLLFSCLHSLYFWMQTTESEVDEACCCWGWDSNLSRFWVQTEIGIENGTECLVLVLFTYFCIRFQGLVETLQKFVLLSLRKTGFCRVSYKLSYLSSVLAPVFHFEILNWPMTEPTLVRIE